MVFGCEASETRALHLWSVRLACNATFVAIGIEDALKGKIATGWRIRHSTLETYGKCIQAAQLLKHCWGQINWRTLPSFRNHKNTSTEHIIRIMIWDFEFSSSLYLRCRISSIVILFFCLITSIRKFGKYPSFWKKMGKSFQFPFSKSQ